MAMPLSTSFAADRASSRRAVAWLVALVIGIAGRASVAADSAEAPDDSRPTAEKLMLLAADGTECRDLGTVPGYPRIGSPAFSPDAAFIALDGIAPGGDLNDTELLVVRADGTGLKVLGDGMMPSWSSDGKQIAFSRPRTDKYGVWVMDAAGDPASARLIDRDGWGIQWSPDGRFWAYQRAGRLVVRDVDTGKVIHQVRSADAPPLVWMWNFAWSPDSRSLCGVVRLTNNQEAVAVQKLELPAAEAWTEQRGQGDLVAGLPVGGVRLLCTGDDFAEDVAWHPHGRRIAFPASSAPLGHRQIYECDPTRDGMPRIVPGQAPTDNVDQCWSPDGKTLVYVAHFDD
jgi:dipeptidyl aminopeptidase/acylaminoacyl peptidase